MEHSLLQRIERFLRESHMPPSVFGRAAAHDPRLVSDLRGGREPGRRLSCRLEHFMNKWRADRHAGRVAPCGCDRPITLSGDMAGHRGIWAGRKRQKSGIFAGAPWDMEFLADTACIAPKRPFQQP